MRTKGANGMKSRLAIALVWPMVLPISGLPIPAMAVLHRSRPTARCCGPPISSGWLLGIASRANNSGRVSQAEAGELAAMPLRL